MKSRVQQHRKSLKIMEYNHRKEAKAKAKKRKEDLSEREGKVEDELKERARLKEEMLKELEKTSTKPSSNSKSPKKTKKHPSPTQTASSTAIVSVWIKVMFQIERNFFSLRQKTQVPLQKTKVFPLCLLQKAPLQW
jgi:hypothetical protein